MKQLFNFLNFYFHNNNIHGVFLLPQKSDFEAESDVTSRLIVFQLQGAVVSYCCC